MPLLDTILKTKRERTLFYITLSVVVGSILLVNFILPVVNQWVDVSSKLSSKKTELAKVKDLLKNEKSILEEYDKYQKGIQLTDPQKRSEDTLLLQADDLQKECNLHYNRLDPVYKRRIPKMPGYMSYTLQVVFEADLLTVGKYLKGMQERGLYIDYLQLAPKAKTPKNPVLQATIRIGKLVSKDADEKQQK